MFSSDQVKQKLKVEVEVTLRDGTAMMGNFFVNPKDRPLEVLNDGRMFLPFVDIDGVFFALNKSEIARIRPTEQSIDRSKPFPRMIGT